MGKDVQERVWKVADHETVTCLACHEQLVAGEEAVECPRCKANQHLSCWVRRGGCATLGCIQRADPSLIGADPPPQDPPVRDSFSWIPLALTLVLTALVIGGAIWKSTQHQALDGSVTLMVPAGPESEEIHRLVQQFNEQRDSKPVNLISIPVDPAGMYYEEKLVIMLAAKEPPDLIILPYERLQFYATQGALAPLDDLGPSVARNIPGERLANGQVSDHLYGIPHPMRSGLFAIPKVARYAEGARALLVHLVNGLPLNPNVDDLPS